MRRWVVLGTMFIFILWISSYFLLTAAFAGVAKGDIETIGAFGDSFGALNALFSGLAFLGVILALILQKQELQAQREEIRNSREAQQQSAQALVDTLAFQKDLIKKRLSLDLFDEWHAPEMHMSRIKVGEWIQRHHQSEVPLPTLSTIDRSADEDRQHVFRIVHFFEKWALLQAAEDIDFVVMRRLLGEYAVWWKEHFIDYIWAADDVTGTSTMRELVHLQLSRVLTDIHGDPVQSLPS